jgi:membrane-associated phospholipid phosphatase
MTPTRRARGWTAAVGLVALALAGVLALLLRRRGDPFAGDAEWMDEILENRNGVWELPSRVLDFVGGGWFSVVVTVALVVVLCLLKRYRGAVFVVAASILSRLLVQSAKAVVARPRPEEMLVVSDFGSFPSGHVANAATLALCLGLLLARVWVWACGVLYVAFMMLSRTYLGAHWVSDTVGGVLVAVGVVALLWAVVARRLSAESAARGTSVDL